MKKSNLLRNLSITMLAMCCIPLVSSFSAFAMLNNASSTSNDGALQQTQDEGRYGVKVKAEDVFSYNEEAYLPSVTSEVYFEENSDAENDKWDFYDGVKTVTIIGGKADETGALVVPYDIDIEGLGKCRPTRYDPNAIFDGVTEIAAASSIHLNEHDIEKAFVKICKNNPNLKGANYLSFYGKVIFEEV